MPKSVGYDCSSENTNVSKSGKEWPSRNVAE